MNSITFDHPIEIGLIVTKIAWVETDIGKSLYIEGIADNELEDKTKEVSFYCPTPLKNMLQRKMLALGEHINIKYLGRTNRSGTYASDFFVR